MCPIICPEDSILVYRIEYRGSINTQKWFGIGSCWLISFLMNDWLTAPYREGKLEKKDNHRFFFNKLGFVTFLYNNPHCGSETIYRINKELGATGWRIVKRFCRKNEFVYEDEYQVVVEV